MGKIKVLIVDDDVNWVKEMAKILNRDEDIIVAGTAFNKDEAIRLASDIDIDIILMDINLSGNRCDGILATIEINKVKEIKTIMLTSLNDESIIKSAFAAGAVNYISKSDYREIPGAIRSAFKNNSPYNVLLKEYLRMKEEEQIRELTLAEKEIYELMEKGYSRSEMQEKLFKSENTIKNHLKNIFKKLKVRSSKEAVEKVKSKGITDIEIK